LTGEAVIRPWQPADSEATLAIFNQAVRETTASWESRPHSVAEWSSWGQRLVADGFLFLVAEQSGQVVGYATTSPFRPSPGYNRTAESSIFLAPPAQGQGLGQRLLAELIGQVRHQGLHALLAAIDATNQASLGLHAKLGFRPAGHLAEVGHKFGRWRDLILVELVLNDDPPPSD
jgi:phosphinothricin acetyltransferase